MIEHTLVKTYNNDILKKNNHVHLNIFNEFLKTCREFLIVQNWATIAFIYPIVLTFNNLLKDHIFSNFVMGVSWDNIDYIMIVNWTNLLLLETKPWLITS